MECYNFFCFSEIWAIELPVFYPQITTQFNWQSIDLNDGIMKLKITIETNYNWNWKWNFYYDLIGCYFCWTIWCSPLIFTLWCSPVIFILRLWLCYFNIWFTEDVKFKRLTPKNFIHKFSYELNLSLAHLMLKWI